MSKKINKKQLKEFINKEVKNLIKEEEEEENEEFDIENISNYTLVNKKRGSKIDGSEPYIFVRKDYKNLPKEDLIKAGYYLWETFKEMSNDDDEAITMIAPENSTFKYGGFSITDEDAFIDLYSAFSKIDVLFEDMDDRFFSPFWNIGSHTEDILEPILFEELKEQLVSNNIIYLEW